MQRFIALSLVSVLAMPTAAWAQAPAAAPSAGTAVDASKMGVDISRIRRELAAPEGEVSDSPLRLSFSVQVLGVAPRIDFLQGFAVDGPIPYGAPTHQEFLDVVTPQAYRSPTFPILGLAVAAAQKLHQLSKKKQCEAEIEEYRRAVMQGIAISAPRCSQ